MDKRFAFTAVALAVVIAGAAMLVSNPENYPAAPLHETISGVEQQQEQEPDVPLPEPEYAYIIRTYEGRVAVFSADNPDKPELVLDTLVKFLPAYDQGQMEQGIQVQTFQELVSLLEDFGS